MSDSYKKKYLKYKAKYLLLSEGLLGGTMESIFVNGSCEVLVQPEQDPEVEAEQDPEAEFNTILQFANQNDLVLQFTFDSLTHNLDWIWHLFPSNGDEYDSYITKENSDKLKTKYIIYHSLMEIYEFHNNGNNAHLEHRKFVYDKVLYNNFTHTLTYSDTQKPLDYYKQFSNDMFNIVGI